MKKSNTTYFVTDDTSIPEDVLAYVVKHEDGYHVIDQDGTVGPVCNRRTTDGYIILTPNASNRKCLNEKNADEFFAAHPDGKIALCFKATRTGMTGGHSTAMPNAKLIAYLPEDLQEEYKAIIARAIEARDAAKAKPMTEREKLEAKLAKAKAAYEKLLAQASNEEVDA